MTLVAVFLLSIVLFFIYMAIVDQISVLLVYKTIRALLNSPVFYLVVILLIGLMMIVDVVYLIVLKETQPPIYVMIRSITERSERSINYDERQSKLEKIIGPVKEALFGYSGAL